MNDLKIRVFDFLLKRKIDNVFDALQKFIRTNKLSEDEIEIFGTFFERGSDCIWFDIIEFQGLSEEFLLRNSEFFSKMYMGSYRDCNEVFLHILAHQNISYAFIKANINQYYSLIKKYKINFQPKFLDKNKILEIIDGYEDLL
jgi:hypothetical protein